MSGSYSKNVEGIAGLSDKDKAEAMAKYEAKTYTYANGKKQNAAEKNSQVNDKRARYLKAYMAVTGLDDPGQTAVEDWFRKEKAAYAKAKNLTKLRAVKLEDVVDWLTKLSPCNMGT